MRSIIDNAYDVTEANWVVSLVCKKGAEHGFLLIQGEEKEEKKGGREWGGICVWLLIH